MKLLVFAGSTRQQSFNRRLARYAANLGAQQGAQASVLELADYDIPLYNADLEARGTPADVLRLKALFDAHPAWIICTPEYNGSYPALLKNTIDWLSSPVAGHPVWSDGSRPLAGKVVGMLSASNGRLGGLRAQSHLAPLLLNAQCWVSPRGYAVSAAANAFDDQDALLHAHDQTGVRGVVEQVLWAAQKLSTP
ncbi:NAD(P)H-dependent oxidoreductase [Acidovorax sp. HDW3]|uniref:NADPH-dependent FMN reductase n=1 Tax=Acidovorax sp. HDW3 TaxID=2714923 RepID=UPI00140C4424|nr:NAD(P)H-dependent oxidoreductase [Acidovorax sp. HDW3]QIL45319.1 NAD(P)H-dependent oxidoreductase [Acidovorax sp. HDW3]